MLRDIKNLHLESTDLCQAACPSCARETDPVFDKKQRHHLDMQKILQVFDVDRIVKLDKMYMCGNYGDPAAGRYTLNLYREFRKLNPNIVLGMNTNGALRSPAWWHELGSIINRRRDFVVFSIDGLADTNHIYRKNVDWNKLMSNVKSYIDAGGNAHWDMLVYQHNQHQVEECKQLAKDLGFKWFRHKVSMRQLPNGLSLPIGWHPPAKQRGEIQCFALQHQNMYIDAQGRVSVCSWLGGTQTNFISDIEVVRPTWHTESPHPTCSKMCTKQDAGTTFTNQWRDEIELWPVD